MPRNLDSPLTDKEAKWVADWLSSKGHDLPRGWIAVSRLTPDQIAKRFHVAKSDVIVQARRSQEKELA